MYSNTDHIILYLFMHFIFILWGYNAEKMDKKSFWITAIFPILVYSIIEGCRYGRGPDYFVYKTRFENYFVYTGGEESLFIWLNHTLKDIGFSYIGAFIVYSLIFILNILILFREHKKYLPVAMTCFFTATYNFTENPIRQAVGFSFYFLAIKFFFERKWVFVGLSVIAASTIHSSNYLMVIFIGGLFFINKPIPPLISIPSYLFLTYIYDMSNVSFIADLIQTSNLSLDSKYQGYIENANRWFSEDAISKNFEQSAIAKTLRTLFDISIFYLGYLTIKYRPDRKILWYYSLFVIGALLYRAFFNLEILRRIADPLYIFWFIIVGYIFTELKVKSIWTEMAKFTIIIYIVLFIGRFIFFNPDARFVWN